MWYPSHSQGREFQTVMKALKNVPDIRKDKVEKIEKQIQSGDYQVKRGRYCRQYTQENH